MRRLGLLLALGGCVAVLAGCASPYLFQVPTGITGIVGVAATVMPGDQASDLVAVSRNGQLAVDQFSPHGFTKLRTLALPAGAAPSDVAAGKFGAGNEVVVSEQGRDALAVYSSLATGAMPTEIQLGSGAQPRSLAAGDLNGDGYTDLAVSVVVPTLFGCGVPGCVDIFNGGPGGLVYSGHSYPLGESDSGYDPRWMTIGKWDGDANPDLIAVDHGTGTVSVWRGDGAGNLLLAQSLKVPGAVTPALSPGGESALYVGGDGPLQLFSGSTTGRLVGLASYGPSEVFSMASVGVILVQKSDGEIVIAVANADLTDPARPKVPGATRIEALSLRAGGGGATAAVVVSPTQLVVTLDSLLWTGPESLDFGKVTVGTTAKKSLTLVVSGDELDVQATLTSGSPPFGSALTVEQRGQGCFNTHSGSSSPCVLPFTFTPTKAGAFTSTVKLNNSGDASVPWVQQPTITLTGVGVAPATSGHSKKKTGHKTHAKPTPPSATPSARFGTTTRVPTLPAGARPLAFGITEDAGKYDDDGGRSVLSTMNDLGMTDERWSLTWDPDHPTQIGELPFLQRAAPIAGKDAILSLYSSSPKRWDATAFCDWAGSVASLVERWGITRFVVGNEPNTAVYWSPPDPVGYEHLLDACYATIHAANPNAEVIGMALSPRSTGSGVAPLSFVKRVAAAYAASPQTHPLMDAVSIHPYPNPNRADDPPGIGYPATQDAYGIPNLDRIKQALYDGFHASTTQPWQVPLVVDEVGWQVDTTGDARYTGTENVKTVTPAEQAQYLDETMSKYFACDPWVSDVLLFHLIDEKNRAFDAASGTSGWQSGLELVDRTHRPAYDTVKADVAKGRAGCTAGYLVWTPHR
jgi:hypothetical protein